MTKQRRRTLCEERGISYADIWAPEKQTVYPEYLPNWMTKTRERERTKIISRELAYHGSSLGALAATGLNAGPTVSAPAR